MKNSATGEAAAETMPTALSRNGGKTSPEADQSSPASTAISTGLRTRLYAVARAISSGDFLWPSKSASARTSGSTSRFSTSMLSASPVAAIGPST